MVIHPSECRAEIGLYGCRAVAQVSTLWPLTRYCPMEVVLQLCQASKGFLWHSDGSFYDCISGLLSICSNLCRVDSTGVLCRLNIGKWILRRFWANLWKVLTGLKTVLSCAGKGDWRIGLRCPQGPILIVLQISIRPPLLSWQFLLYTHLSCTDFFLASSLARLQIFQIFPPGWFLLLLLTIWLTKVGQ